MNAHEVGFLAFLEEPSRRRIQMLLEAGAKRRKDIRQLLHHKVRLDPKHASPLTGSDSLTDQIKHILRAHGAPDTCYVLSALSDLDGREMPLGEALSGVVGSSNGSFVSCVPGRLGYYEYESVKSSYLLSR